MRRFLFGAVAWFLAALVTPWAWIHERRIRRLGRELGREELADARSLGVRNPARVRVLPVARTPNPLGPLFRMLTRWTRLACSDPAGLTLRYGIYAVPPSDHDRLLIAHELVHTSQYERVGGLWPFLWRYIYQCLADGYSGAEWEREACRSSAQIRN